MAASMTGDSKEIILTGTMACILFTCFIQGGTVEVFVKYFNFGEGEERKQTFLEKAVDRTAEHMMSGISAVMGGRNKLLTSTEVLGYYDKTYIQPVISRGTNDDEIIKEMEAKADRDMVERLKERKVEMALQKINDDKSRMEARKRRNSVPEQAVA